MKGKRSIPDLLDAYEQGILLRQPNPGAPTGLRNLCLISLFLRVGLRVSEIISLCEEDIDWDAGLIRIAGSSTGVARTLQLARPELNLLRSWRSTRPAGAPVFFSTLDGRSLSPRYLREMVKRLARKAGITKDVYPNLLRFTFAADFLKETGDSELLQRALGYRNLEKSKFYRDLLAASPGSQPYGIIYQRSGLPVSGGIPCPELNNRHLNNPSAAGNPAEALSPAVGGEEEGASGNQGNAATDGGKPDIRVTVDTGRRTPIPALKCKECNYILRYQQDCPQCGTAFSMILKHWGRIL